MSRFKCEHCEDRGARWGFPCSCPAGRKFDGQPVIDDRDDPGDLSATARIEAQEFASGYDHALNRQLPRSA
jgi:hypothetical protein